MHPPLEVRQHPHCKEYILALKQCHAGHPVAKFWGVCNDAAKALNVCLQEEKAEKRAKNRERLRAEQARLRTRFEARRQAEAEAQGRQPPPAGEGTRLPGYWVPEQRGIPGEQAAAQ